MTGNWIVHGDVTTSGGRMISSSPFTDVDGKGVCRKGDKATCPQHKGVFPITGGYDPTTIIDDQEVAPCTAPRSPVAAKFCLPSRCVCSWMQAEVRSRWGPQQPPKWQLR